MRFKTCAISHSLSSLSIDLFQVISHERPVSLSPRDLFGSPSFGSPSFRHIHLRALSITSALHIKDTMASKSVESLDEFPSLPAFTHHPQYSHLDDAQLLREITTNPKLWHEYVAKLEHFGQHAASYANALVDKLDGETEAKGRLMELLAASESRTHRLQETLNTTQHNLSQAQAETTRLWRDFVSKGAKTNNTIPDIPIFHGDHTLLSSWLAKLRVKLQIDRDLFPTSEAQLAYAFMRTDGAAAEHISRFVSEKDGSISFPDLASFCSTMIKAFGTPRFEPASNTACHDPRSPTQKEAR